MQLKKIILSFCLLISIFANARVSKIQKRYILWPYAYTSLSRYKRQIKLKPGTVINAIANLVYKNENYVKFYRHGKKLYIRQIYTHPIPGNALKILKNLKTNIDHVNINPGNPCIYGFKPGDLIKVPVYQADDHPVYLRKKAALQFFKMAKDAELEGLSIIAHRGYISAKAQAKKYYLNLDIYKKRIYFPKHIDKPVTSNLQTGVTVDITSSNVNYKCEYQFFFSKEYKWLINNSYKYGFFPIGGSRDDFNFKPYRFRFYYNPKYAKIKDEHPKFNLVDIYGIAKLNVKQKGNLNITYFKVHDSETTASHTIKYLYNRYGGRFVDLINTSSLNSRYLILNINGKKYRCDPNRIFTDVGVDKLKRFNSFFEDIDYKPAKKLIRKIRKKILSVLKLNVKTPFIYLHTNNYYSRLSVHYLHRIARRIRNTFEVYYNNDNHPKAFVYVLQKKDFIYFIRKRVNTIRQIKYSGIDDGSLSIYAEKKIPGLSYATVETINEDAKVNKYLSDLVVRYFIKKHKLKY